MGKKLYVRRGFKMNLYFPVFGGHGDETICRKWMVRAATPIEALKLAQDYFGRLSWFAKAAIAPSAGSYPGPIYRVELVKENKGIIIL